MSFILGNDNGKRRFGDYEVKITRSEQNGEEFVLHANYILDTHSLSTYALPREADSYIASRIIEKLANIGINVSKRERKGVFVKGTHMTFNDDGMVVEVGGFGNYVEVKGYGNKGNLQKLFSGVEDVISNLEVSSVRTIGDET